MEAFCANNFCTYTIIMYTGIIVLVQIGILIWALTEVIDSIKRKAAKKKDEQRLHELRLRLEKINKGGDNGKRT